METLVVSSLITAQEIGPDYHLAIHPQTPISLNTWFPLTQNLPSKLILLPTLNSFPNALQKTKNKKKRKEKNWKLNGGHKLSTRKDRWIAL